MSDHTTNEPTVKLCECGCGQPAPLAKKTSKKDGHVKGQPVKFIKGHRFSKYRKASGPNPGGLCMCGCGQPAPVANHSDPRSGTVAGQPYRYIHGHATRKQEFPSGPNPSGLCMCGCGQPAPIAAETSIAHGRVQGKPIRFIPGHHQKLRIFPSLSERFWAKVDKRGPSECWLWTGAKGPTGYGHLNNKSGSNIAHRISYELHFGPIPQDMCVCHNCPGGDNPSCVNPSHLWLGTQLENIADMKQKGNFRPVKPRSKGESKQD